MTKGVAATFPGPPVSMRLASLRPVLARHEARVAASVASFAARPALARGFVASAWRVAPAEAVAAAAPSAAEAALAATAGAAGDAAAPKRKYFSHFKRAGRMLNEVRQDHMTRRLTFLHNFRPDLPHFDVGDAVELEYVAELAEKEPSKIRGLVIAKRNRGLDSSFTIINHVEEDSFMATYKFASPLLRGMRVMRRRHATNGKKPVRRAKLYYMWERPESEYKVTRETKEQWEVELEAKIRRELQRRGRNWGRKAVTDEKEKLLKTGKGIFRLDTAEDEK